MPNTKTGYADVNGAQLYYELAGEGQPFVMIHAGVADCRMWNNEFAHFSAQYQVLRFDMRGYGKSKPVDGEFNIQDDLVTLLETLNIDQPIILMGCSIGAGLAIDYTLTYPDRVQSLIVVGGGPAGLDLDTDSPDELFAQASQAFEDKNLDLVAEIEAQIWFDGMGRTKDAVDSAMRQLAIDMNRIALENEASGIGKHVRKTFEKQAVDRLNEITLPMLIIIGANDIPYLLAAADYMADRIASSHKAMIPDAAHLPNMDHPALFRSAVEQFLEQQ